MQSSKEASKEAAAFGSNQQYVHLNTLLLFMILAESPAFGSPSGYCTEDIFLYLVTPVFLINISVLLSAHFVFHIPHFHMCTSVDGIMHATAGHLWMLPCNGFPDLYYFFNSICKEFADQYVPTRYLHSAEKLLDFIWHFICNNWYTLTSFSLPTTQFHAVWYFLLQSIQEYSI